MTVEARAAARFVPRMPTAASPVLLIVLGTSLLCVAPLVIGGFFLTLMTEAIILALFAVSVNLLLGHTGLVSLGQAAYYGTGAYGFAIACLLFNAPASLGIAAALAASLITAVLLSYLCLKTSGVRFLLITLAFSQLLHAVVVRIPGAGGDDGLISLPRLDLTFLGVDLWNPTTFHVSVFIILAAVLFALWRFLQSPFGTVLAAIRENEVRARAVGYRVMQHKRAAFILSGLIAGLAGMLQAQNLSFVSPEFLSWKVSAEGILMVIIGGRKWFLGPVIGTVAFLLVREFLSMVTTDYLLFFGLFFMLVVAVFPDGLMGSLRGRARDRLA